MHPGHYRGAAGHWWDDHRLTGRWVPQGSWQRRQPGYFWPGAQIFLTALSVLTPTLLRNGGISARDVRCSLRRTLAASSSHRPEVMRPTTDHLVARGARYFWCVTSLHVSYMHMYCRNFAELCAQRALKIAVFRQGRGTQDKGQLRGRGPGQAVMGKLPEVYFGSGELVSDLCRGYRGAHPK